MRGGQRAAGNSLHVGFTEDKVCTEARQRRPMSLVWPTDHNSQRNHKGADMNAVHMAKVVRLRISTTTWTPHIVAGSILLMCASGLAAHDFWLVPDAFAVTPGGRITLRGQTSSLFPTSLSAVTPDRIVEARVVTANSSVSLQNVSVLGSSLRLTHRAVSVGQHLIGVQLAPRNVRESPASFRRYLDLEGAPEARQRFEQEGLLPAAGGDSITRRYAKYSKTVVEVGKGARAFERTLGHPLEFVPLSDPSSLRVGDTLRMQLLLLGKPATLAKLHAGAVAAGATAVSDTLQARRAAARDATIETDRNGQASIVIDRAGLWNIRTLQIVPATKGTGADWDVHWATFVFSVAKR